MGFPDELTPLPLPLVRVFVDIIFSFFSKRDFLYGEDVRIAVFPLCRDTRLVMFALGKGMMACGEMPNAVSSCFCGEVVGVETEVVALMKVEAVGRRESVEVEEMRGLDVEAAGGLDVEAEAVGNLEVEVGEGLEVEEVGGLDAEAMRWLETEVVG